MCGILGIIPRKPTGFYAKDMDLLETMMMFDTLRGRDSAGAAVVGRNSEVMVVKHASRHVTLLFETKQWKDLRSKATQTGRFVFAHNRAATRGKTSSDNAHPFVEGKITLVHNGTIWNQKELEGDKKFEVDSNAIAHALNEGKREDVLKKINGAFALIWFDHEEDKLFAVRNDERPLSLITTDEYYMLASEAWMCATPWMRQGMSNQRTPIRDMRELEPGELLSWNLKGDMEVGKLTLLSPEEDYRQWSAMEGARRTTHTGRGGNNLAKATKETVQADMRPLEDQLDDCLPFVPTGDNQTPEEITNLKKALTAAAQAKQRAEQTSSKSCVLTQSGALQESMSTTPSDSRSSRIDMIGDSQPLRSGGRGLNDPLFVAEESQKNKLKDRIREFKEFPLGTYHLVKVIEATKQGSLVRWTGKIRTPGKPMYDCSGYLPAGIKDLDWMKYLGSDIMCRGVVRFVSEHVGGPSVWISNIGQAQTVDVYGQDISWMYWARSLVTGCDECGGRCFEWERPFTQLTIGSRKSTITDGYPVNTMRTVCPDCLKKALPTGEIYDAYVKRYEEIANRRDKEGLPETDRHPTVQNRKSLSKESGGGDGKTLALPAPPTLQ